jgi:hypothetical protein
MLNIAQCTDREKVLYALGRLTGPTVDWWDAYCASHATADTITWTKFSTNFWNYHIHVGLMKIKKEFLSLKHRGMAESEYIDKFIQLSRYAPEEVADDEKKQELFLEWLIGPLAMLHHREPQSAQVVGNTHIRALLRKQCKPHPKHHKLVKLAPNQNIATLATPTTSTCFKCGEAGHYAIVCPKKVAYTTPAWGSNLNRWNQSSSNGKQAPPNSHDQRGYNIARVNQISVEATVDGSDIVIVTFFINSISASILFDSGASHSFISAHYVNSHDLPLVNMCKPMVVIKPKELIEANFICHQLDITILGRNFWATPIVLERSSIDLILCMTWLTKCKAIIHFVKGTVELTSPDGDRFEVTVTLSPSIKSAIYLLKDKFVGKISV